jgi:hypothetical protein
VRHDREGLANGACLPRGLPQLGFYFLVDNPEVRAQESESLYLLVAIPKTPRDALDQVLGSDVVVLPCEVTLLDNTRAGCGAQR